MSTTNPSTPDFLSTLTSSITSSLSSLPTATAIQPPPASFSLLSTKNELFLTYLQNLTFWIILNLRRLSSADSEGGIANGEGRENRPEQEREQEQGRESNEQQQTVDDATAAITTLDEEKGISNSSESDLRDAVVENLVGLRVYLEKGVRPLEGRLKYQLDKLLLAAADHAREKSAKQNQSNSRNHQTTNNENEDEPNTLQQASSIPPLAHRPNPSALIRPYSSSTNHTTKTNSTTKPTTAPYRPPRINPTLPPTSSSSSSNSKSASTRGPRRSRAVDAFIREEMADAPLAELSIGAGAGAHVRRGGGAADQDYREADRARERKDWEESRLTRLPGESQQQLKKRKRGTAGAGGTEDIMAGMDWGLMNNGGGGGDDDGDRRGEDRGGRKRHKKTKGNSKKGKGGGRSKGRK